MGVGDYAMLAGNLASIGVGAIVAVASSFIVRAPCTRVFQLLMKVVARELRF